MSIRPGQFHTFLLRPVLDNLEQHAGVPYSTFADVLLMATCAQESHLGEYVMQDGGPAISIFQFEPATFDGLWNSYIVPGTGRWRMPLLFCGVDARWHADTARQALVYNNRFAVLCARLYYYRVKAPLPVSVTLDTLWDYYKPYWNTAAGKATKADFAANIRAYTDLRL